MQNSFYKRGLLMSSLLCTIIKDTAECLTLNSDDWEKDLMTKITWGHVHRQLLTKYCSDKKWWEEKNGPLEIRDDEAGMGRGVGGGGGDGVRGGCVAGVGV